MTAAAGTEPRASASGLWKRRVRPLAVLCPDSLQLDQLPIVERKDGILAGQFAGRERTMALHVDVEGAIAKPQFGHEQHVPTVERVIQEGYQIGWTHVRIEGAELLDHIPAFVAQRQHG